MNHLRNMGPSSQVMPVPITTIGANLTREAFGVRGIPALWHVESGGMRRTPNASRIKLALMPITPSPA